ncbi:hypothetical protein LEP1GSC131_3440 [Leptospira kirschneri str. 200802841]|uniref:Uncharacterized protein n=1 Tax=Leptospira kirschneri str. 200802841 TaxID=1193047 RepID=A0A828Y5A0_9LEPT|nr:hypothetical protein LEP1GSC131_1017 [Leptospira kirschneri str. 200802841]EKO50347.1 hypothetical protein LEP1GSC131_3440 [Leptospira kirschneri str. 200802841]
MNFEEEKRTEDMKGPSRKNGLFKKKKTKSSLSYFLVRISVIKTTENGSGNEFHTFVFRPS